MKQISILDKGWVRFVDSMGTDKTIVDAARISYGPGTRRISTDRALLRYLMRHHHHSPIEMCEMMFVMKVPIYVMRQLARHRTFNVNERSLRYSEAIDDCVETAPEDWRIQSDTNKQGSSGFLDEVSGAKLSKEEAELHDHALNVYKSRLKLGVAREQARKDLPLSNYTELYWKNDLRNLLNFLNLRLDEHTQYETRLYANAIAKFVEEKFPITWEAFQDYSLNSIHLTVLDHRVILRFMKAFEPIDQILEEEIKNKREKVECKEKLKTLGLIQ